MFSVVAADAANALQRDAFFGPFLGLESKFEHGAQDFGIFGVTPEDTANLGVHVGGDKATDGCLMAGEAEREIVLQLLFGREGFAEDVLPAAQDADKAVGGITQVDEALGFGFGQGKEGCRIANLREQGFGRDPFGPRRPGSERGIY